MKFVYPEINNVFDTGGENVNTLIIENQGLMVRLLGDIYAQSEGLDGKSALFDNGKELPIGKSMELLTQFVPFDINKKTLLSKICSALEKEAASDEYFVKTNELLGTVEAYLNELSSGFRCDLDFSKINFSSLIKASGAEIEENYDSLGEKIIDYFELVTEFDRPKLFFTVNLRSYLSDDETYLFIDTALKHGYNLIMAESHEHKRLKNEDRFIIDSDLCEIK